MPCSPPLPTGRTTLANYAPGGDCASTLACLAALGVAIERARRPTTSGPRIGDRGPRRTRAAARRPIRSTAATPAARMRMLAGVVAAHPFVSTLIGDRSLSRRPMRRIIAPLSQMGARIEAAAGDRPPLTIHGGDLDGIDFVPDVPSAQVKSAVLLAGLQADGRSRVTETTPTRDHTERALTAFGAAVVRDGQPRRRGRRSATLRRSRPACPATSRRRPFRRWRRRPCRAPTSPSRAWA